MVRLARANGVKLQTLSWLLFGNRRSPWNRDIDRSAPPWLVKVLSERTGNTYWQVFHTTLATYRARLYPKRKASGVLRWVLPIRSHGMAREGFGQQLCPACLASDVIPYFRKSWRLAIYAFCPMHRVYLVDACPGCGEPIAHYRGDFGRELTDALPMHVCPRCRYDWRDASCVPVAFPDSGVEDDLRAAMASLALPVGECGRFDIGYFAVLRHLCWVMSTGPNQGLLGAYVSNVLGLPQPPLPGRRVHFEQLRVIPRLGHLVRGVWLMGDLESRLDDAWRHKAIRYNLMLKDFEGAPRWYRKIVSGFSDWRKM
jgi:hypothetical protein